MPSEDVLSSDRKSVEQHKRVSVNTGERAQQQFYITGASVRDHGDSVAAMTRAVVL